MFGFNINIITNMNNIEQMQEIIEFDDISIFERMNKIKNEVEQHSFDVNNRVDEVYQKQDKIYDVV